MRFGELLPDLRRTLDRHLALGPYEREWACAVAVTLVNRAWFRVGSERHLRASRTYGITTLSKRHVTVRGRRVGFRFPGKHRIAVRTTVVDPEIADAVRELLRYDGGARLLRFDRDGTPANLTAALLNEYIREHLGEGFTAKDFRTWGGTLSAARSLADRGLAETASEERRILAAVMRRVGEELGNTPAVARTSYVSPAVVEQWRDGRTLDDFARRRMRGLSADETALLALLRSWRIRRARGRPAR